MSLENTSEPSFHKGEFIGSGSFGDVFVGRYNTRKVAIKRFKVSQYAERQTAIDQEISILRHLQCRHIIQFMGVRREDDHIYLITDFAEGGSLKSAIDSGRTADWSLKRRVAQEIANGLAYIHHENILHRDLKSDNVLLTIHMEVKLCDFGFAVIKKSSEGHSTSAIRGTRLWLAPELLVEERPQYSNKSDMYAFGMVMWEMAAMCTHPFKHKSSIHAALLDVQKGEREKLPDHTSADYRQWVELCWRQDPTERPEAQETSLVEDVQLPPQHANNFISLSHDSSMLDSPVSDNSVYGGNTAVTASPDKDAARTDQILDPKKLARLWREAEEFDDADAQFSLAEMYEAGSGGVMKDDSRAFSLYLCAARQGRPRAMQRVGDMYNEGRGTFRNEDEAAKWHGRAGDHKQTGAAEGPATIHSTASSPASRSTGPRPLGGRLGGGPDGNSGGSTGGSTWLRRAVKDARVLMKYGLFTGSAGDYDRGYFRERLTRSDAINGDATAQLELGDYYSHGVNTRRDNAEAVKWYTMAANQGDARAQFSLGWMYECGLGVMQDDTKAMILYTQAASQRHPDAQFCLGRMYEAGRGVDRSDSEACRWYTLSAHQGYPRAQYNLGLMYESGRFVELDESEAVRWFTRAARQGHSQAQHRIGQILDP